MADPDKIQQQYDTMYSTFQAMGLNPKGDTPEDLDKWIKDYISHQKEYKPLENVLLSPPPITAPKTETGAVLKVAPKANCNHVIISTQDIFTMKKKQYDPNALKSAYDAVQNGMSVYKAAKNYGIPESTLRDRTLGLVSVDGRCSNYLFDEGTEKMVDHIAHMASIGYGYSRIDVIYLATDLAVFMGKRKPQEDLLSNKWYYSFMKRWPNLTISKPQKLSMQRARCASKETLSNYYKELGTIMTKNNLHEQPHKIFNMDESALQTEHSPGKIVHDIVVKPQSVTSPRSSNVTIIGAGNAIGNAVPPYYVFPGVNFDRALLLDGTPPCSDGQCSKSGWSNSDIFKTYLEKHFLKEAQLFMRKNPGCKITRYNIGQMSCSPYQKGLSSQNLTSSFRKSGIYPFNPKAVDTSELAPATIYPTATSDETTESAMNNTHISKDDGNTSSQQFSKAGNLTIQPFEVSSSAQREHEISSDHDESNSQPLLSLVPPENRYADDIQIYTAEPIIELNTSNNSSNINTFTVNRSVVSVEKTEKKRKHFTITGNLGKRKTWII
ncbi:unnamed protein product [Mytilus coruscus]|uniref:HTH psq-type domain-containing protein n=1 Tax=Mytilus coruscus TaxID=42192 RepID=A0A6J8DZ77_MYTCO|nr:unnamed protein product [Mytilus coruscus]